MSAGLQAIVHACTLSRNSAVHSGAVHLQDQAHINITNSKFTANSAREYGAAVFAQHNSCLAMTTTVLKGNNAASGGGVALDDTATATISGVSCTGNVAAAEGGCMRMAGSKVSSAAPVHACHSRQYA